MAAEVAAIVLAAGRATRFAAGGGAEDSKVLALLDGRPLLVHVVAAAFAADVRPVVVVTGRGAAGCAKALRDYPDVTLAHNGAYGSGLAGSLRCGLAALPATAAAAVVLLADMPRVRSSTIDALVAVLRDTRADAVVPTYAGLRGNPVVVARALFPALMRLEGDEGARRILSNGVHRVVSAPVDDPGVLVDVDTREALDALAAQGGERRP